MANFYFADMSKDIRNFMLSEIDFDIENNKLYISSRLNEEGVEVYLPHLKDACENGDEKSFEENLKIEKYFNSTYLRQGKEVKMPSNASQLLSQSEFNRYYIRAICLKAIENSQENVEIYRARESSFKRPGSDDKIGTLVSSKKLLEDLRESIGKEPNLLPEINSGLSVKLTS